MPYNSLEARFADLEAATRVLTDEIRMLSGELSTLNDLREKHHDLDVRTAKTRRAIGGLGLAFAIILPLTCVGLYASVVDHVDQLFDQIAAQRYSSCIERNKATAENIRREDELADADSEIKVRAIHIDSARRLRAVVVNCDKFRR